MNSNETSVLPDIPDALKRPGRLAGYHRWCEQVDNWVNKHGITRKQAVSILFFDSLSDKEGDYINVKELYWVDSNDFAMIAISS